MIDHRGYEMALCEADDRRAAMASDIESLRATVARQKERIEAMEGTIKKIARKMPKVTCPISLIESERVLAWTQGVNDCADYYVELARAALKGEG